jgi:hypothetical protein
MKLPPFAEDDERRKLAVRLAAIDGLSIPEAAINKRPSFKLNVLTASGNLERFLAAFDWGLTEIKKVEHQLGSDLSNNYSEGARRVGSEHGTPS